MARQTPGGPDAPHDTIRWLVPVAVCFLLLCTYKVLIRSTHPSCNAVNSCASLCIGRRLQSLNGPDSPDVGLEQWLTLPRLPLDRFDKDSPLQCTPGTYSKPWSKIQAAIDGVLFLPVSGRPLLLQCTVSRTHPMSDKLVELLEQLPDGCEPIIVFVVPPDVYSTWTKEQRFTSDKRCRLASPKVQAMLASMQQWVLLLEQWEQPPSAPLDHLGYSSVGLG
jgi:hypothetical protein